MAKPKTRAYSRMALHAVRLLGESIRAARLRRRMTAAELAERAGVSRGLVSRVENGDAGTSIGPAFEMAAILGIPLFDAESGDLSGRLAREREITALLPKRACRPRQDVEDDF